MRSLGSNATGSSRNSPVNLAKLPLPIPSQSNGAFSWRRQPDESISAQSHLVFHDSSKTLLYKPFSERRVPENILLCLQPNCQ